jgi:hypothetical protein
MEYIVYTYGSSLICAREEPKRKNFFQSHTFLAVGRKLFLLATTSSGKKTLERKVKLALQ